MNANPNMPKTWADISEISQADLLKVSGGGPIFCYRNPHGRGNPTRYVYGGHHDNRQFALFQEWKSNRYVTIPTRIYFSGEFKKFCRLQDYRHF